MSLSLPTIDAVTTATAIRNGDLSVLTVVDAALERITERNPTLNCFTAITHEMAKEQALQIERAVTCNLTLGSLVGVPFAVKNLFDVAGMTTLAGSKIYANHPPAQEDATAVARLQQAGAVLVGTSNMDEYAYGFVTENSHYGVTRNPHDITRIAGGSSGGSAAAVAAGLVPLALGSDTNGSVRVPAALCGVYGFKPTYGRISRAGIVLFASSFDHVGIFARSIRDVATVYDFLQGDDERDPVASNLPPEPTVPQVNLGLDDIKVAVAGEYFAQGADPEALEAVKKLARALKVQDLVTLPESHRARAAAYIITASEGANLHLAHLRSRPQDFDPATRDRFLAGALIPTSWYIQAQRFRSWYRDRVREVFQEVDVILAPTTPCVAPPLGAKTMMVAGEEMIIRAHLGRFTQPLSFIGLPVLSVPVRGLNDLPLGVQLIAAPYNEALILRVAAYLERQGVTSVTVA